MTEPTVPPEPEPTVPPEPEPTVPPEPEPTRRRHRRAVRPGVEQAADDARAWEDDDRAWGDSPRGDDERLRREIPPHWG